MVAYATITDLEDMALPAAALVGVSTEKKNRALEAASRKADSYFRVEWGVPITNPNDELKYAVCVIAGWRLMVARGFAPEAPDSNLRTAYEDAIKWLERCADGTCKPFDELDDATPGVGESGPLISSDGNPNETWDRHYVGD